jgi:type I restriction enzyme M protein
MIRGPVDGLKFKDYILPLVFLKRLSDVFDDEIDHLAYEFSNRQMAAMFVEQDHQLVRFYIPEKARWSTIAAITTGLGQPFTDALRAVAREKPRLFSVIDVTDFNATTAGPRIVDDGRLAELGQVLNHHFYRLRLDDVEPDILGRAYEYLLRKFAEGQGQSVGEFYTPRMVAMVTARLLDWQPGMCSYDPCCGSGGMFVRSEEFIEAHGGKLGNISMDGQESNYTTWPLCKTYRAMHSIDSQVAYGDRFYNDGHRDLQVDCVLANLPFNDSDWHGELLKDDKRWVQSVSGRDLVRAWREAKNDSEVLHG